MKRSVCLLVGLLLAGSSLPGQERPRLPRERRLDPGGAPRRDLQTGELRYPRRPGPATPGPVHAAGPIQVRVDLVELGVNVVDARGNHVAGLTRDDFRLLERGAEQAIAHFDASTAPASVALVFDASPSVFREIAPMKEAARSLAAHLAPRDEVAVVAFAASARLLLPFSADRALLERAIASMALARSLGDPRGSNVYEALHLAALELFAERRGRKAIVILTDGQDSGLGLDWSPASAEPRHGPQADRLTFEDVCRTLTALGIEVYAISTQNRPPAMTEAWLAARREQRIVTEEARHLGMPHYTLYLTELVRRVGGRLYFLRELPTLARVYQHIAENLRAQYTLGYYPGDARPGWRALRVELPARPDLRIAHRAAYYVPARP